jgi:hypothetical protein
MNSYIQALLVERAGYVARNLPKRVASIDEALKSAGYQPKEVASVEPRTETASVPPVKRKRVAENGDN